MITTCLQLFWEFFKTGLFAVGGGMATLPFLQAIGESTGWYTYTDLMNMLAVSESTPGPIGINMATYVGFTAAGIPVRLTKTEYAIFKLFLQNPGQAIAKSVILDRISADTPDCTESSLKIHISNLRRKLREVTGTDFIESVWGIGFKLNI